MRRRGYYSSSSDSGSTLLFIGLLLLTLVCGGKYFYSSYTNSRDLDSLVERAQVAANPDKVLEYVNSYKETLESRGLTSGHFALIFTKPTNSYEAHYEAVTSIIERLEKIKAYDRESDPSLEAAFQTGLDDVRGVLRELEFIGDGTTWVENFIFLFIGGLGAVVLFIWGSVKFS